MGLSTEDYVEMLMFAPSLLARRPTVLAWKVSRRRSPVWPGSFNKKAPVLTTTGLYVAAGHAACMQAGPRTCCRLAGPACAAVQSLQSAKPCRFRVRSSRSMPSMLRRGERRGMATRSPIGAPTTMNSLRDSATCYCRSGRVVYQRPFILQPTTAKAQPQATSGSCCDLLPAAHTVGCWFASPPDRRPSIAVPHTSQRI